MRLIAILLCLLVSFPAATAQPYVVTGVVTSVHDGDTLRIGHQAIRLWGVNAVELSDEGGYAARDVLRTIALGQEISCVINGKSYKRLVGQCTIHGRDVAEIMIDQHMVADVPYFSGGYYAR